MPSLPKIMPAGQADSLPESVLQGHKGIQVFIGAHEGVSVVVFDWVKCFALTDHFSLITY
jgi:hypothetical protein